MQSTSEIWKTLLSQIGHEKEVKLNIAGVEYSQKNIVSVKTSGALYDKLSIGNCVSRQISLQIIPISDIPRQAKIKVFVRLKFGNVTSEWLQKGEFFFSTRNTDKRSGIMSVEGYDAMLKAEQDWLSTLPDSTNWPMPAIDAVNDICAKIGVTLDSRTQLSNDYQVGYPVGENGNLTMREVLSYVAIANAGNFCITDRGELLLIGLTDFPPETYYLITDNGEPIIFGGDRIILPEGLD